MLDGEVCLVKVWNQIRHRHELCNRPAKGHLDHKVPACGIHLNAERKRNEREELEEARALDRQSKLRLLRSIRGALALEGVAASVSERGLIIAKDDALKLVERLRGDA